MSALQFALACLAVYRLTHLITIDEGPWSLMLALRLAVGQKRWWGRGLHCPLCVSFWLSLLPALLWARTPESFVLTWLGVAGAVVVLHRMAYR